MWFNKKRIAAYLIFFFFMDSPGFCGPIEIGMLDLPPYYILGKNDAVEGGILVDMLDRIFDRAGIEHTFAGYPARRLYSNVAKGITQVWLGTLGVPEYEGKTIISPKILAEIKLQVYAINPSTPLPKSLEELKGKSVITILGYHYGGGRKFLENPENNIASETANSHEAAFMMLKLGRATYVLDYSKPADDAISQLKLEGVIHAPITTLSMYIHISKTVPDAQVLMDRLMNAYDELKKEGKL